MLKLIRSLTQWVSNIARTKSLPVDSNEGHLTTMILAMTVSYRLPLPSSPVDRPEEWYLINCFSGVEERLGTINESTVMYIDNALNLSKQIWLKRYRLLHFPFMPESIELLRQVTSQDTRSIPGIYGDLLANVTNEDLRQVIYDLFTGMNDLNNTEK